MAVETHQDIFQGGQVREESNILIGAGNSQSDDLVGQEPNEVLSVKEDFPGFRTIETGNAVEQGCLAGSVGSDDAVNALLSDFNSEVIHSHEAAKPFGHAPS
jgi:hypothetical protein